LVVVVAGDRDGDRQGLVARPDGADDDHRRDRGDQGHRGGHQNPRAEAAAGRPLSSDRGVHPLAQRLGHGLAGVDLGPTPVAGEQVRLERLALLVGEVPAR
jgi:hypothetical protein